MTEFEKDLLAYLQEGIPIVENPFTTIAKKLSVTEDQVIESIKKLKNEKIIRQISPIYDTKALGYDSSLVAFKVKDIDKAVSVINAHPGVSHNYERNDDFNIWFTLAVPPDSKIGLEDTVEILADLSEAEDYVILKTVKMYKIGVKLTFNRLDEKSENGNRTSSSEKVNLYEIEKNIIKVTQEDIPLDPRPFNIFADRLGISVYTLLHKLNQFKEKGVMRRFAAILYHRKAGFKANGMTVWKVPEDKADAVGEYFASFKAVSHCYLRTVNGKWSYNLFSMIHGREKEEIEDFVEKLSKETGINDYKILYSTREFKKKRVRYFSDEFKHWEEAVINGKRSGANIQG
ncbi:siroheme decarboxylase subunit alpha [Persephonella sp.]